MPTHAATLSLSGGEISPLLYHRIDLEKRASALARCENFLPLPYGGLRKRPGTRHITDVSGATDQSRLIPFRASDGTRFLITITATQIRARNLGTNALTTLSLDWPLVATDLPSLRWQVLNDVIYFVHPSITPMMLSYQGPIPLTMGLSRFVFEPISFTEIPERDENLTHRVIGVQEAITANWATGTAYTSGQRVMSQVPLISPPQFEPFVCIANHTSAAATMPLSGANWQTVWRRANWETGVTYPVGIVIRYNQPGEVTELVCTAAHTSSAANEPLRGSVWDTVWQVRRFSAGDTVQLLGAPNVTTWASGTAYTAGSWVSQTSGLGNISFFKCLISHTSNSGSNTTANRLLWAEGAVTFNNDTPISSLQPGTIYSVQIRRDDRSSSVTLRAVTANNGVNSTPIIVSGDWTFTTFDTWGGIYTLERSKDNGATWQVIGAFESTLDSNFSESFTEDTPSLIRMRFTSNGNTGSGSGSRRARISTSSAFVRGRFVINSADASNALASATCLDLCLSGTTTKWSESAFSRSRGFPAALAIYQRRLYFAANRSQPLTLWASRLEDFAWFRTDTKDDDAFRVTLQPTSQNRILWLAGQRRLHIGTEMSEWVVGSETRDEPVSPTNFLAREYTTYGSSPNVTPILVGDAVLFLQRHDQRIRELGFVSERETYDAADLTRLAEHLLLPNLRITGMAWQESREPTLWCCISDGTLRALTYIRQERIFAWSRHRTQFGRFVQVAVSPTQSEDDEVYFLVERGGVYQLEVLPPNAQALNEQGATNGLNTSAALPAVFDSQYTGPAISGVLQAQTRWGGLGRYVPQGDSATRQDLRYLAAGSAPVAGVTNYVAGIPVIARAMTLPLEMDAGTGASMGRLKRASKVRVLLYLGRNLTVSEYLPQAVGESAPVNYAPMQPSRENRLYGSHDMTLAVAPMLTAGWVEATVNLSSLNLSAEFRHTDPTPCTLNMIVIESDVSPS